MSESAITVSGLKETQKALYSYSQQLGDKVILSALRQGAAVVLRHLRGKVPVRTGLLKRRGFRVSKSRIHAGRRSGDLLGIYITLRRGKGDPFYGRFQNDGYTLRDGSKVPGKHFVQTAFEERKAAAVQVIVQYAHTGALVLSRKVGFK